MLRELHVTRGIIETYFRELLEHTTVDVAIVGAGPSGLVAGYLLAKAGKKVAIFERKLAPGGGIWGGGMLFNKVVVQRAAEHVLKEFEVDYEPYGEEYLVADAVELASALTVKAVKAGAKIFNAVHVEDVVIKDGRVGGVVVNWTPVDMVHLHVDPLVVEASFVLDGTGHDAAVVKLVARRTGCCEVKGMGAMWVDEAEKLVVEKSGEVYPGLFVMGMATAELYGLPRMGPIFGGMFLSGEKVAREILSRS
ncbi:MAG: thiazole biosynthesis protein [Aquificae bacterium]|nr:thiazole biosynthesis protein [Aquificota bacterium]